jgi:hypothetical protein
MIFAAFYFLGINTLVFTTIPNVRYNCHHDRDAANVIQIIIDNRIMNRIKIIYLLIKLE